MKQNEKEVVKRVLKSSYLKSQSDRHTHSAHHHPEPSKSSFAQRQRHDLCKPSPTIINRHHVKISAAQILGQDMRSEVTVSRKLHSSVSGSTLEESTGPKSTCDSRPGPSTTQSSTVQTHHERFDVQKARPSRLMVMPSGTSDNSRSSPTAEHAPVTPLSPKHTDSAISSRPSGRGIKRVAHKCDRDIKRQRLDIEHKLTTPVTPTSPTSSSRRSRLGSAPAGGNKGLRATLIKQMTSSKK